MENGCLRNHAETEYFNMEFLNTQLLEVIPDSYNVCYSIKTLDDDDNLYYITFYLYDSVTPMNTFDQDYVIGSISCYIDIGDDNDINIDALDVNSELLDYSLRSAGFGTYLLFIAVSYAKSIGIENIVLDDMSHGYRTQNNIYLGIGLKYDDPDSGPEMVGKIDDIYENIDEFIEQRGQIIRDKLNDMTEYFDDEEYVDDEDDDDDDDDDDDMQMDGGSGPPVDDWTASNLRLEERRARRLLHSRNMPTVDQLPRQYRQEIQIEPIEVVENRNSNSIDSPPSEPDMGQMREEAARDIQRRMRGNRQRRKLTKKRPRYGKMASPTTEREKMRRWTDLTRMYLEDDPIRGYEQFSIYPERLLP